VDAGGDLQHDSPADRRGAAAVLHGRVGEAAGEVRADGVESGLLSSGG